MVNEKYSIQKHYIYSKDGVAYCSKCGSQMISDSNTINQHKRCCSPYNFLEEKVNDDDYLCLHEVIDDFLVLHVYKPELFYGESQEFEHIELKQVYKVQFSLKSKDVKEWHLIENTDVKKSRWISLTVETVFEIIYRIFGIPFTNIDALIQYYQRFYPIVSRIDDSIADELLKDPLDLPDDYYSGFYGSMAGKLMEKEQLLKISIFNFKNQETSRFLIGKNFFYTKDELNIPILLRKKLPSLILDEDLRCLESQNSAFKNLEYWNEYNLLIPLFAQFDPQMQWLIDNGCFSAAKNYYAIDRDINTLIHTLSLKTLQALDDSCFQDPFLIHNLLRIHEHAKEYLEVDCITYTWLLFLTQNIVAFLEGRRTSIQRFSEMELDARREIAEHVYDLKNHAEDANEELLLYLDYEECLNRKC